MGDHEKFTGRKVLINSGERVSKGRQPQFLGFKTYAKIKKAFHVIRFTSVPSVADYVLLPDGVDRVGRSAVHKSNGRLGQPDTIVRLDELQAYQSRHEQLAGLPQRRYQELADPEEMRGDVAHQRSKRKEVKAYSKKNQKKKESKAYARELILGGFPQPAINQPEQEVIGRWGTDTYGQPSLPWRSWDRNTAQWVDPVNGVAPVRDKNYRPPQEEYRPIGLEIGDIRTPLGSIERLSNGDRIISPPDAIRVPKNSSLKEDAFLRMNVAVVSTSADDESLVNMPRAFKDPIKTYVVGEGSQEWHLERDPNRTTGVPKDDAPSDYRPHHNSRQLKPATAPPPPSTYPSGIPPPPSRANPSRANPSGIPPPPRVNPSHRTHMSSEGGIRTETDASNLRMRVVAGDAELEQYREVLRKWHTGYLEYVDRLGHYSKKKDIEWVIGRLKYYHFDHYNILAEVYRQMRDLYYMNNVCRYILHMSNESGFRSNRVNFDLIDLESDFSTNESVQILMNVIKFTFLEYKKFENSMRTVTIEEIVSSYGGRMCEVRSNDRKNRLCTAVNRESGVIPITAIDMIETIFGLLCTPGLRNGDDLGKTMNTPEYMNAGAGSPLSYHTHPDEMNRVMETAYPMFWDIYRILGGTEDMVADKTRTCNMILSVILQIKKDLREIGLRAKYQNREGITINQYLNAFSIGDYCVKLQNSDNELYKAVAETSISGFNLIQDNTQANRESYQKQLNLIRRHMGKYRGEDLSLYRALVYVILLSNTVLLSVTNPTRMNEMVGILREPHETMRTIYQSISDYDLERTPLKPRNQTGDYMGMSMMRRLTGYGPANHTDLFPDTRRQFGK